MRITKTTIKHNVFCLLVILLSYLSASVGLEVTITEADSPGGEVAPVLENIVPNGHGPPTGRPWSGHVDRNSYFYFRLRFLCEFCTFQMPICHDLAPVMASEKPLDRSCRPSSLNLHAQLASLELRMPMTESKGGGVALPRGPSITLILYG